MDEYKEIDTEYLKTIGVVNGVFSADNLPQEWKEQLKQAGVRKKDLNNAELRKLLFPLLMKEKEKSIQKQSNEC